MAERYTNVWDALVEDQTERESCKLKSKLLMTIELQIQEQGLTQQQAAEKLGVTQPRISDLMRGKMDRFSIDTLVNMLASLGIFLDVQVRKAA